MESYAWSSFSSISRHLNDVSGIFYIAKWFSFLTFLRATNFITACITHCTKNHIFFSQMFWKKRLSKTIALEYGLSCIIRKDDIFFPKIWSYSLGEDERWSLLKYTWKYDIFCTFGKDCISFSYRYDITFLWKKKRWSSSEKTHLKMTFPVSLKQLMFILENMVFLVIEKLKMIENFTFIKSSIDFLYFYGKLYRRFLSNKKAGLNI